MDLTGNINKIVTRDISILIIDDDPMILKTITRILKISNPEYYIVTAEFADAAYSYLQQTYWDTILLDISIPTKKGGVSEPDNGLRLLEYMKNDLKISTPVIAITGFDDDELSDTILDLGAYYFLSKPLRPKAISAIVRNSTRFQLAGYDGLTGLLTKESFEDRLEAEFGRAQRKNHQGDDLKNISYLSLIFFDGDNFKQINDAFGHLSGDKVLRKIGSSFLEDSLYRLTGREDARDEYIVRPYDIAARFGGDEFSIFLPETNHVGALAVARRIREKLSFIKLSDIIDNSDASKLMETVSLSIGVATYPKPNDVNNYKDLILKSDEAMYASKGCKAGEIFGYDETGKLTRFE